MRAENVITVDVQRQGAAVPLAWASGAVMVVLATSLVGLFVAPVAVPAALYWASRRQTSWAARIPLLLGALALSVLVGAWLLDGARTGSTADVSSLRA